MKTKRLVILIILIGFTVSLTVAQDFISTGILQNIDSVRNVLKTANNDTVRVDALVRLSNYYKFNRPDSAIYYSTEALTLANQIKYEEGIISAMTFLSISHQTLGNYPRALQIALQGIKLTEKYKLNSQKAHLLNTIGLIYFDVGEFELALQATRQAIELNNGDEIMLALSLNTIGSTYRAMNQFDSALFYNQLVYKTRKDTPWLIGSSSRLLGRTYKEKGDYNLALRYFHESLELNGNATGFINNYHNISQIYRSLDKPDSSLYYGLKSYEIAKNTGIYSYISSEALLLSDIYEKTEPLLSLEYAKISIAYRDSLELLRNKTSLATLVDFDEQERQYELDAAKAEFQNSLRMNIFLGSTFTLLVIAFFLYRNNRQKQKSKLQIEGAYNKLKSTQAQLIQSEKMASLGELTAGIAHEIQNPLNFVNNFSEVSAELVDEIQDIRRKTQDRNPESEEDEILEDIKQNLEKINHHGKRADAIVKGMLEHSRTGSGEKEQTDINSLASEYLTLAYQSFKSKNEGVDIKLITDLDPTIPKIELVRADIGKVLLNILNNAFYAVGKWHVGTGHAISLEPMVIVTTKLREGSPSGAGGSERKWVKISISDNGPGIPDAIKDKIFQPFFTTKPTGQGTGLGLSLSYDIVKAHGGELKVETLEGEGTTFIIELEKKA
jgi:signal transduction histidine kinase